MNEHQQQYAEFEDEINLLQLLQVIVKRKNLIIYCCTAAFVLSVCYSLTLKNIYTATAKLLPPQKDSGGSGLSALLSQAGGLAGLAGGMTGLGGSSELYIGILKSRTLGEAVVKRLDLQKEFKTLEAARQSVEGSVKFLAGKDGLLSISADSTDPKKAALLANTYVDELGRRSVQLNLIKAGTERIFLEKRLEVVKRDLKNAENDMKSFQEKYKTIKADSQVAATISGIAGIKAQIASKEVQLATLRNSMTDEHIDVKTLKAAISSMYGQLRAMSGSGDIDVIPSFGNTPGLGVDYYRKLRELKIQEAIFEQLSKQYEVAKLSEAKDTSSLQVLDEAVAPLSKSKPKRSQIVILSTVTAFFASIFFIFIQEYLSKLPPEDAQLLGEIKQSLFKFRN